jgi:RimJ/RimL family protein N-acetyltransferase
MRCYACLSRPKVELNGLSLSTVQPGHIERIRQWRNAQIDVLRQADIITPEQQVEYFEQQVWPELPSARPRQILLAVHERDVLIGYGGLVHIAWPESRAEVSFLLDPAIMNEAVRVEGLFSIYLTLIRELAFCDLGLRRLVTETFAHRTVIIKLLERNGFVHEGTLREHILIKGVPTDSIVHGSLAREYA